MHTHMNIDIYLFLLVEERPLLAQLTEPLG